MKAEDVIRELKLQPHPEGGAFVRTYTSAEVLATKDGRTRAAGTAIYYLITEQNFSAFHRIKSDELFHYYGGDSAELHVIADGSKELQIQSLGINLERGERPQVLVPALSWQACRISKANSGWTLLGTTVVPGFDFADFELGERASLLALYPHLEANILKLTR